MAKATLTALAWHQSWILWSLLYLSVFYAGSMRFGWLGVLWAWAILATLQVLRAYS